jgi:hypothetical protein
VLHRRIEHEYRAGIAAAIRPTIVRVDNFADESRERRSRLAAEQAIDQVLADSFPASDPPSWNPGISLLNPAMGLKPQAERAETGADAEAQARASDIIDVSRSSDADRTFLKSLVSFAGAAGIALLVPLVILVIGLPIVLLVRGVLELTNWFFGGAVV